MLVAAARACIVMQSVVPFIQAQLVAIIDLCCGAGRVRW